MINPSINVKVSVKSSKLKVQGDVELRTDKRKYF